MLRSQERGTAVNYVLPSAAKRTICVYRWGKEKKKNEEDNLFIFFLTISLSEQEDVDKRFANGTAKTTIGLQQLGTTCTSCRTEILVVEVF